MAYLFRGVGTLAGTRCVPYGGTWRMVTERQAAILGNDLARDYLRAAFRDGQQRWPFRVDAAGAGLWNFL